MNRRKHVSVNDSSPAPILSTSRSPREHVSRWTATLAILALLAWAFHGTGLHLSAFFEGSESVRNLLRGFLSPALGRDFLLHVGTVALETVQISLAGVALAAVVGLPLAVLIAGNTETPGTLRAAARGVAAGLRGVPDLLWALLFVAMIGPGPAAGVMALAVHGAGLLAKLCSEQLEAVDPAPVEALRLTGAGRMATTALAVIPQARAGLASLLLYQWECNIRTSAVLGFVGAGGIGQELAVSLRLFRFDELSTLVLTVLGLILLVDQFSRLVRRRLGSHT